MRKWKVGKNAVKLEVSCDKNVTELGYGDYLISALQKIVRAYGNSNYVNDEEYDSQMQTEVRWGIINATELLNRRDSIKNDLYYKAAKSNSGFFKRVCYDAMNWLGIKQQNRYTGNIAIESITYLPDDTSEFLKENNLVYDLKTFSKVEALYRSARNTAAMESSHRRKEDKRPKIPSQLDLDAIEVEIDRISNHMDRRYVLDLIYNQIEIIENLKERFELEPDLKRAYAGKAERMLEELADMRKRVLAKRNFDQKYKVFVKYPEGYEG